MKRSRVRRREKPRSRILVIVEVQSAVRETLRARAAAEGRSVGAIVRGFIGAGLSARVDDRRESAG